MRLVFATRPSALARWQTNWVIQRLKESWPDLVCEQEVITTQGDRILDKALPEIGGKGLFTQELEAELLAGKVDAAVHSLKDLPIENPAGILLGAVPAREDVRDGLISARGYTLETLPVGALVGTSSLRRAAQVLARRPDVEIKPLRGNVDTRVRKAMQEQYDAIVLAGAGLRRLGLDSHVTQWLTLDVMLPAPGQGALAVQCRADNTQALKILSAVEDAGTRLATRAERAFLGGLGGGCSLPVAAYARLRNNHIEMNALAASVDGKEVVRVHGVGDDPKDLGANLANAALAQGAGEFLHV
ncbi:MAG: hydroxymethylbilane synthase [Anaerolineales bacterium]|jgi:hydroxymethylbilane synthase